MVTYAEDNPFPSVLFAEHVDPSNPAASHQRLFVDTDHLLKLIDSAGTVTTFTGGGLTDPMTSRGDVIVRNASNVTARLAKGSAGTYLGSDGTDVAYSAVTDAQLSTSDITTNNASTTKHGFAPKYPNDATKYLDGTGAYTVPAGSGGSLTLNMNQLSGNVTMTTNGTFYDGPTLSCTAGTWLITASICISSGSNATVTGKIWDGTTDLASAVAFCVAGGNVTLSMTCKVTPGSTLTYRAAATSQVNGNTILAAAGFNGVGNNVSTITALKVA